MEASTGLVFAHWRDGQVAATVAGRFSNGTRLRRELREHGSLFQTMADAEVLLHLVAQSSQRTLVNRLVDALWKVDGGFCVLVLTEDAMIAVRDPRGVRPLVLGRLGDGWAVASEDTALRLVGAEPTRSLAPGEMLIVEGDGAPKSVRPFVARDRAACVHELVDLAREDATAFDRHVAEARTSLGQRLARERGCPSRSVIVGLPGAGETIAVGFAQGVRARLVRGLVASPAPPIGLPGDSQEEVPWTAIPSAVSDNDVVLVVPSISTGKGVAGAVGLLRQAGARSIHIRAASPPLRHGCPYGVSSPTSDELAATRARESGALARLLGADTVDFLTEEGLHAVAGRRADDKPSWCDACFSGKLPISPEEPEDQLPLF